jgi:quinolinate synthase
METLPPMPVVTYVNSTAAVKALSTICCTSANVIEVVASLDSEEVLMTPDRNLAKWAALHTEKKVHFWNGCCPLHDSLRPEDVQQVKTEHPDAIFMAHPECRMEVLELADVVVSTSGMIKFVESSEASSFIVGTEIGLIYPLQQVRPDKKFYPASLKVECVDMKKITLQDVVDSLEFMKEKVTVPEDIRVMALQAVQSMVNL